MKRRIGGRAGRIGIAAAAIRLTVAFAAWGAVSSADEWRSVPLSSRVEEVQPLTGLVLWTTNGAAATAPIQLEFSYASYRQVVSASGEYDWTVVDRLLERAASRRHQLILRWYDTYVGKPTGVPESVTRLPGYRTTRGRSEGKPTEFPDWSHEGLRRFAIEFFDRFAERYDEDPRLAYLEVGFGLWSEYHIYDGPMKLGETFPSQEFQEAFARRLNERLRKTRWMISVDAASAWAPFAGNKELLALPFGVFDDSFNHREHEQINEPNWNTLDRGRWRVAPTGGEFAFYEEADQSKALAPEGPYGKPFERHARDFHVSFMIADAQPRHHGEERLREAGMACGYRFRVVRFETSADRSRVEIENTGIAPIYYDAHPAVDGARAQESLKGLLPGERRMFEIEAGGNAPRFSIECDRLVAGQRIGFDADL